MAEHPPTPSSATAERRALEVLTGDGLSPALASVLEPNGLRRARDRGLSRRAGRPWRRISVHHRPGAGVTGIYAVPVRGSGTAGSEPWPGPAPWGEDGEVIVCLSTGALPARALPPLPGGRLPAEPEADGPAAAEADGLALAGWLWPQDPWLPALRSSRVLLDRGSDLGLELPDADALAPRAVSYRPTRRAVLRLDHRDTDSGPRGHDPAAWVKIVRPERESGLIDRHLMAWRAGVPVPRPLAATGDGAVLISHLGGRPASHRRAAPGIGLEPEHLLVLLARLPRRALGLPRRPSWTDRVLDYARAATAAAPQDADRVQELAARIDRARRAGDDGPLVPSHGDFHAGNLMVGGPLPDPALGPITGLLDLDSMGPGRLVDDLGCYAAHRCAHLAQHGRGGDPLRDPSIVADLAVFDEAVEPAALRTRIAGVLLSLVSSAGRRSGPEAARQRLRQAEAVLSRAVTG